MPADELIFVITSQGLKLEFKYLLRVKKLGISK